MGKSAQFPLHVWLPDAMEGPTPVSALIHAATMVNAGVYFIARTSPLFASAPSALLIVAAIGIFTAILAASIALTQKDIKRVLAYSTLSQLGYMFAALGVGAFVAAIFHLMAHGFTKGLLFLGSGSVIHAVDGEQDMDRMGALRQRIPITHWTFLIGALSLAGIPPLAGFFSKDSILGEIFLFGYGWIFLVGFIVAGLTGFYMFRLMGKTFYGESHVDPAVEPHVHESPRSMTVPLIILAFGSLVVGFLGVPEFLGGGNRFEHWLAPVFEHGAHGEAHAHHADVALEWTLMLMSVAVAATGVLLAYVFYYRKTISADAIAEVAGGMPYRALYNKYYVDELYDRVVVQPIVRASRFCWRVIDAGIIDGTVNAVGWVSKGLGWGVSMFQTGNVSTYAFVLTVGVLVILGVTVF